VEEIDRAVSNAHAVTPGDTYARAPGTTRSRASIGYHDDTFAGNLKMPLDHIDVSVIPVGLFMRTGEVTDTSSDLIVS
jgi:hypothetical protein